MATLEQLASYPAPSGLEGHGQGSAASSGSEGRSGELAAGETTPKQQSSAHSWAIMAVDDLQLSPALTVSTSTSLDQALHQAALRDFSILPVTDSKRQLVGYLDASVHRASFASLDPSATVSSTMRRFERSKPYQTITPDTDLATLNDFLKHHDFAIVSDASRRFVLGVVTREDLIKFKERWAPNGQ